MGRLSSVPTSGMLRRKPRAIGKKSLRVRVRARVRARARARVRVSRVRSIRSRCGLCAPEQVEEAEALDAHADDWPAEQHQPDAAQEARRAWRQASAGWEEVRGGSPAEKWRGVSGPARAGRAPTFELPFLEEEAEGLVYADDHHHTRKEQDLQMQRRRQ